MQKIISQRVARYTVSGFVLTAIFCLTLVAQVAFANVLGTDAQNFNTTTDGLDFVTVHSSETLQPGILNLGFFTNYAQNTFSYLGKTRDGSRYQDGMISSDFNFGMGLAKNFDAGISFPWLISAWDNGSTDRVQLKDSGLTEVRVNGKIRLAGDRDGGLAFVASANFGLIQNNPYAGEGAGPTYNIELAGDKTYGRLAAGLNAGYRMRTPGKKIEQFPIEPLGDQVIASGAVSYLLHGTPTKLIAEIFAGWPMYRISQNTDRTSSTYELIGGVKHDLSQSLAIHGGAGTKLTNGVASPDWRVYVGLNYVIGPLFGKPQPLIRKIKPDFSLEDDSPVEKVSQFWDEPTDVSERFVVDEILFGFNSDRIVNEGAKTALSQFAEHVEKPPRYKMVVIEGHTDSIGGAGYNLDLSQRRANNIRKYLVENNGIDPKRIKAVGYGESRPIADNGNFQGRAKNRRVEFKVYREGIDVPEEYR